MELDQLVYFISQALVIMLMLSLPTVFVGAIVGLLVGLFQGLTQIQDQTISFALRLVASVVTMALTSRWLGIELHRFTIDVFDRISAY